MSEVSGRIRRTALSLLELLVVVAILAVLLALILPAVQKARESAVRMRSANNLRQIVTGLHAFASAHDGRLPTIWGEKRSVNPETALFVTLLPYVEQEAQFRQLIDASADPSRAHYRRPQGTGLVSVFVSPADPTRDSNRPIPPELDVPYYKFDPKAGLCSYPANGQLFLNNPRLDSCCADGTASTLAFAERYSYLCGQGQKTTTYWYSTFNAEAGYNITRASFAEEGRDVWPVTSGNPPVSLPSGRNKSVTFQTAPLHEECNPRLAQTPHRAGMLVGVLDGSVKTLSPTIAPPVYWALVTPAGGEVVADW